MAKRCKQPVAAASGRSTNGAGWRRVWTVGVKAFVALGVVALSYGLPLALVHPVFQPRMFVGIGVVMASLALIATRAGWRRWWNRIVAVLLAAAA